MSRTATEGLHTHRLVLTPLRSTDASEMVDVLGDRDLYAFTGGSPPTLSDLETQYMFQAAGPSSGDEVWHNWIMRSTEAGLAMGFVQATVTGNAADLAWVVGVQWQSRGYASEAASAMCEWLSANGVERFTAHIHPEHVASQRVAAFLGLQRTEEVDGDGEVVWASPSR